jgi:hypothetical protein
MPVKSKRAARKPAKRKGSYTALYFSLGAVTAALTAVLVTLLRRNLMARASDSRMDLPREGGTASTLGPALDEKPSPP